MSFEHYKKWNSFGGNENEGQEQKISAPASEEDMAYGHAKEALISQDVNELADALKALPPEQIKAAVHACKEQGNASFKSKDYERAIEMYTNAIAGDPRDGKLFSNRSACNLALGRAKQAFEDADRCVALDKDWPKGYYRAGRALLQLGKKHSGQAEKCFVEGLKRDPSNKEMKTWLQKALVAKEEAMADVRAEEGKIKQQQRVSNDYSRFDAIPDPEPPQQPQNEGDDDWQVDEDEYKRVLEEVGLNQTEQFKPTFQRTLVLKGARKQRDAPATGALSKYLEMAGELHTPRRVVDTLMGVGQEGLLRAYRSAVVAAAQETVSTPPRWVVLGVGAGVSTLVASKQLGIGTAASDAKLAVVTARKGAYQARAMARLLKCNGLRMSMGAGGDAVVAESGNEAATTGGGGKGDAEEVGESVTVFHSPVTAIRTTHLGFGAERASVLVLGQDLMDEALLGLRLLPSARHARLHLAALPKPAAVIPAVAKVMAAAVQLMTPTRPCGFAAHHLDRYRWSPSYITICADNDAQEGNDGGGLRFLSAPVEVFGFDFTRPLNGDPSEVSALEKELDADGFLPLRGSAVLDFEIQREGTFNGIVFWSELAFEDDKSAFTASNAPSAATMSGGSGGGGGGGGGGNQQAMQYLEWPKQVRSGDGIKVLATHTSSHVHFELSDEEEAAEAGAPAKSEGGSSMNKFKKAKGKHRVYSHLLQHWQLQHLANSARNHAYVRAVIGAIKNSGGVLEKGRARWKDIPDEKSGVGGEGGNGLSSVVANVLHVNCGCALFAMTSVRAGAGEVAVLGCDASGHLLETATEMIRYEDKAQGKGSEEERIKTSEVAAGGEAAAAAAGEDAGEEAGEDAGEEAAPSVGAMESRISLAVKDIRQLKLGESLALPFDCAVFEGIDCTLLGEGILHLAHHAWKHMLREDAIVVPSKAQLYVMAIELHVTDAGAAADAGKYDRDLDISAWKSYCFHPEPYGVHLHTLKHTKLTEPMAVPSGSFDFGRAAFDLAADKPTVCAPVKFELQVVKAGKCNALVFWHDLTMGVAEDGAEILLSSAPVLERQDGSNGAQSLQQALQLVDEVCMSEGEAIPLVYAPTTTQPRFGFDGGGFEKLAAKVDQLKVAGGVEGEAVEAVEAGEAVEAVEAGEAGKAQLDPLRGHRTSVPLYDPAWMLQSRQLQEQGAKIAEMCSSNPEGFKQAADAACTLAVDPYGSVTAGDEVEVHLDPAKTLLFASSFFN
jgi:tetratricopeptide (TPR) repeat protein